MNETTRSHFVSWMTGNTLRQLERNLITKRNRLKESVNEAAVLAEQVEMLEKEIDRRNDR